MPAISYSSPSSLIRNGDPTDLTFFKKQLSKVLLGAISPNVRPPHLNSLAQQCANNGEQWDKQDDHDRIRIKDRLADKEKEKDPADEMPERAIPKAAGLNNRP